MTNKPKIGRDPKISVLVSVYNTEKYLEFCLESLHNQTLIDSEFIIVDDGSTDRSLKICQKYIDFDERFKLIKLNSNIGLVQARQRAITEARGCWSIFLDSDDFLSSNRSLEILLALAEHYNTDILRFNIDLVGGNETQLQSVKLWRGNFKGKLDSPLNILTNCFVEKKYSFTLWDKLYRTSVLKQTTPHIQKEHLVCAEDAYLYFVIAFYSNTFCSIDTEGLYTYRLNSGVSTGDITTNKFSNYAKEKIIIKWLKSFLIEEKQYKRYSFVLDALETTLMTTLRWRYSCLNPQQKVETIPMLLKWNSIPDVVDIIYGEYKSNPSELADSLYDQDFLKITKEKIQTVGIFYHRIFSGGVERVVSLLIPLLLEEKYKVVLFIEEESPENEYKIPQEVTKVKIPKTYETNRAKVLFEQLQKNKVDVFLHQSASSWNLPFDLTLIKLLGIPAIVTRHELTTQDLLHNSADILRLPHVYKLADKLTVLSRMEEQFYKNFSIPVEYVPNPVPKFKTKINQNSGANSKKNIIWLGRLEQTQKNFIDALKIMKQVSQYDSDIQFYIVGKEESPGAKDWILNFINQNNLADQIHFEGFTVTPEKYYKNAYVYLCTSSFESWSMTIFESKLHGIPLVTYEMPYLEILHDGQGTITVKQGDIDGAASSILKLVNDSELHHKLSMEARNSILNFYQDLNLGEKWTKIIQSTLINRSKNKTKDAYYNQMFWDVSLGFYKKSLQQSCRSSVPQIIYRNKELTIDEQIKIYRYDTIVSLAKKFLPDGTRRKQFVKRTLTPFYRIIQFLNKK